MIITTILQAANRVFFGPLPHAPNEGDETGLVLMADGVGGLDLCGRGLSHMVARSRPHYRVRLFPWSHGFARWHADLSDSAHHRVRAEQLAGEVLAYRDERPGNPIFLVAKSGGCGPAVWALERLPDASVESAVLIAPALSPTYDLSMALRAVRRQIVVFWSPFDVFILGVGTWLFGTIDRIHTPAAGMSAFQPPADPVARAKLRQVRWHPRMARSGYFGGHVSPDNPLFLRNYVVPLLDTATTSDSSPRSCHESSPTVSGPIT